MKRTDACILSSEKYGSSASGEKQAISNAGGVNHASTGETTTAAAYSAGTWQRTSMTSMGIAR